jgi:hypothetical protein
MDIRPFSERRFDRQPEPPAPKAPYSHSRYDDLDEATQQALADWIAKHVRHASTTTSSRTLYMAYLQDGPRVLPGAFVGALFKAGFGEVVSGWVAIGPPQIKAALKKGD